MKIFIKYMVSLHCKVLVMEELKKIGLAYTEMDFGSVTLTHAITKGQRYQLKKRLLISGLELQEDRKAILVERMKQYVMESLEMPEGLLNKKFSVFLSEKMKYEYNYLSNVFTEVEGLSIQKFIILRKIEKVKELLAYGELNLTEIAYRLHYSSGAHLSNQFKRITGLSPSVFRKRTSRED